MNIIKHLYTPEGKPVGINARFSFNNGKAEMIGANEGVSFIKTVSLTAFWEEMLIELRKQIEEYFNLLFFETVEEKNKLFKVLINNWKKPDITILYEKPMTLTHDGMELYIPQQQTGVCAENYKKFREKLLMLGYIK